MKKIGYVLLILLLAIIAVVVLRWNTIQQCSQKYDNDTPPMHFIASFIDSFTPADCSTPEPADLPSTLTGENEVMTGEELVENAEEETENRFSLGIQYNLYDQYAARKPLEEQRYSQGYTGFLPANQSGFILSGGEFSKSFDMPVSNNFSTIFFSDNANNGYGTTFNGTYTIQGKIMKGVEKVEVIRDGDNISYFLKNFTPLGSDFTYNISSSFENIKPGKNVYLIRGYQSPNFVFERTFELYFITGGNDITLQPVDADTPSYTLGNICSLGVGNYRQGQAHDDWILAKDMNTYFLGISNVTLAKQIFTLPNMNITIVYQNTVDDTQKMKGFIMILNTDNGQSTNIVEYGLGCNDLGGVSITAHSGGYLTIYQSIFEGNNDTLIYNPNLNTIISINDDLLKPTLQDDFYFVYSYQIQKDTIVITEKPYCCDDVPNPGGYEEFVFDLPTKKMISRKSISQPAR